MPVHTEAVIDTDAVSANTALLASRTQAALMAVVKADGYGHGLVPAARAALAGGAAHLGVATLDEARQVRAAGITAPVLAWLHTGGQDFAAAVDADVELSAASRTQLADILAAAERTGRRVRIHLKADTGLSRSGAAPDAWPRLVEDAAKAQAGGLAEIVGVWSHLARADEPGADANADQLAAFHTALDAAAAAGLEPRLRHLANSAGTLTFPDAHFDLVRPGIALYGLSPIAGENFGLRPAMTLRAGVALVKRVPAGSGVSYGHTYTTSEETTLALIPLGYGDGVPRAASNRGPVELNGEVFRVAGRVCMDQLVLDVGDHPVAEGDVATLFGPDAPRADEWADLTGTINYEIVTRIAPRVPRRYTGAAA